MDRGLYIHIPFCLTRCYYCNFISIPDPDPSVRRRVLSALAGEMGEAWKRHGRLKFDTVYLGGGTPSVLSPQEMTGLFEKLRGYFDIAPDAEITCEWNPGDGDDEKLSVFKALGVNRISLGVQSFQDPLLVRLGRRHTVPDTFLTLAKIRNAGIQNISFDLMLRIPGQTLGDFQASLEKAVELNASQISLYDLEVHPETLFGRLQKEGKLGLPEETEHAAMYEKAMQILTAAGYEHYEISNFAKPGMASRHNLIYWHNQEYLGIGPGAFSYLNGARHQFAPDIKRYLKKCEAPDWRPDQEDVLSEKEKETETFVTGLRLREGVRPADLKIIYPELKERVATLFNEGLLEGSGGTARLTARGKFVSEEVFGFLLRQGPC